MFANPQSNTKIKELLNSTRVSKNFKPSYQLENEQRMPKINLLQQNQKMSRVRKLGKGVLNQESKEMVLDFKRKTLPGAVEG